MHYLAATSDCKSIRSERESTVVQISKQLLGKTEIELSRLGFGGAPIGDLFEKVPQNQAHATLQAAWKAGIRYFDTSPFYGYGKSEQRLGYFLREKPRDEFVISTKVGRVFKAARNLKTFDPGGWVGGLPFNFYFDYSYDGIMRSWEDSLTRMGLNSVDLLLIHDLDSFFHDSEERFSAYLKQLITSGWRALEELRDQGLIKGVGAGLNRMGALPRLLDAVKLDFSIVAMPYTLLDQEVLDSEFPLCNDQGVNIIIGSVFASGILVHGPVKEARYAYAPATNEIINKTQKIQAICQNFDVPLPAAALQFPLAHPLVTSVIPGAMAPEHIRDNVEWLQHTIPSELWSQLKEQKLLRDDTPTP